MARARRRPGGGDDEKKGFLERAGTIIGVLMGCAGLVTFILTVPGKVDDPFGRKEREKERLELEQKRAEVRAAGPRVRVSYLFLDSSLVAQDPTPEPKVSSAEARTLLSLPIIRNEVLTGLDTMPRGCKVGRFPVRSVAFLVIENRGRRDADRIRVVASRLRLTRSVTISEARAGDDYVTKLRANSAAPSSATFEVPRALGPASGVRIPLWLSASSQDSSDPWCVYSRTALQPVSVTFRDDVLETDGKLTVRGLASPQILASGVEARG